MDRVDNKVQIAIDFNEIGELRLQFEKMFILADQETSPGYYNEEVIQRKFPKVWELYLVVCH